MDALPKDLDLDLQCYELNDANCHTLHQKGYTVLGADFLRNENRSWESYDRVIAVPPYRDQIDTTHIMSMYSALKTGGILSTLTLPTWTTGIFTIQREFRGWLTDLNHQLFILPDFGESYFNVPVAHLVIRK